MAKTASQKPAGGGSKATDKPKKFKLSRIKMIVLGVVAVISFLIWFGMQPLRGTMAFGICRVFLEQSVEYPPSLKINSVESRDPMLRINYTEVNPFGNNSLGQIDCTYRAGDAGGIALSEVTINAAPVKQEKIDRFNLTIPTILAYPPSLDLPPPTPDALQNLQSGE